MTKDTHAREHQLWQSTEAAGKALAGASWPSAAPVTTERDKKTQSGCGGLSGVFFLTADTAANERAGCNTVHLEN